MIYKNFNKLLIVSISFVLLSTIVFNFIINPYNIFNTLNIKGLNQVKNNTINTEMSKFYALKRLEIDTLITGTSRSEHLNPTFIQKFTKDKVYNLSMPGSGIKLQKENIEYFVKHKNIKRVILGLDFFAFNPANNSKDKHPRYDDKYISDYQDSLLSIRTLRKSIKTLKDNLKNKKSTLHYENGYRHNEDISLKIKNGGIVYIKERFKKQVTMISTQKVHFNNEEFKNPSSINKALADLNAIVNLCKDKDIELIMFISPLYVKITELIYKRGYGFSYEYWKKELAKYGDIYDFSSYNKVTKKISNYIDGSHYQEHIAKLIVEKLLQNDSKKESSDFGIILNMKNIDIILKNQAKNAKTNNMKVNK